MDINCTISQQVADTVVDLKAFSPNWCTETGVQEMITKFLEIMLTA
jgi:hypothetical protein